MTTGYKHCNIYNCSSVHLCHRSPFKRSCDGIVTSMNFTSVSLPQSWTRTKALFSLWKKGDWFLPTFSGIRGNDFRIFFPIMQELWQEELTKMLGYYQSSRHTDTTSKCSRTQRGWGSSKELCPLLSSPGSFPVKARAAWWGKWKTGFFPSNQGVGLGSPSVTTIGNLEYKPSLQVWWSPNINQNISKSRLILYRCSVASVCVSTERDREAERDTQRKNSYLWNP